jgi:hypothetical protein
MSRKLKYLVYFVCLVYFGYLGLEAVFQPKLPCAGRAPQSMKIAGMGARSAEVSQAFQLPSGDGSRAAGMTSLGRGRVGLRAHMLGIQFSY